MVHARPSVIEPSRIADAARNGVALALSDRRSADAPQTASIIVVPTTIGYYAY